MIIIWIYLIIGLLFWLPILIRDIKYNQYRYGNNTHLRSNGDGTWRQATHGAIDWSNLIGTFIVDFFLWPFVVLFRLLIGINMAIGWILEKIFNS